MLPRICSEMEVVELEQKPANSAKISLGEVMLGGQVGIKMCMQREKKASV